MGMNAFLALSALLLLGICTGCNKESTAAPPADDDPKQAQPKLQTLKLWIGPDANPEVMTVELALTSEQLRTGMMWRTNMAENEGMLFVFPMPHRTAFWMKNTILPLSAAYIDPDGTILEIHDLQPHNTNSVVATSSQVQFVLETRQGWFQRHHIAPGMLVRTELGTLKQSFSFKQRDQ